MFRSLPASRSRPGVCTCDSNSFLRFRIRLFVVVNSLLRSLIRKACYLNRTPIIQRSCSSSSASSPSKSASSSPSRYALRYRLQSLTSAHHRPHGPMRDWCSRLRPKTLSKLWSLSARPKGASNKVLVLQANEQTLLVARAMV